MTSEIFMVFSADSTLVFLGNEQELLALYMEFNSVKELEEGIKEYGKKLISSTSNDPLAVLYRAVVKATEAANAAGDLWLANAKPKYAVHNADPLTGQPIGKPIDVMLDVCGNSHVQVADKRSKFYKAFKKMGIIRSGYDNGVVEINHKFKMRQEYGLAFACATAAKNSLIDSGVTGLRLWSYVD
jgi:hypothetical protein